MGRRHRRLQGRERKIPRHPQAAESDFWIAFSTQQKGDNAGAIPLFDAFIKANGNSTLIPPALYYLGAAQITAGKKDEGAATLVTLAEKYPDSPAAPSTYFIRSSSRRRRRRLTRSTR